MVYAGARIKSPTQTAHPSRRCSTVGRLGLATGHLARPAPGYRPPSELTRFSARWRWDGWNFGVPSREPTSPLSRCKEQESSPPMRLLAQVR